jgi:hypothetical protein
MSVPNKESRINLAIEAINSSKKISLSKASVIYEVSKTTLRERMNGRAPRSERRPNRQNFDEMEEEVLSQHILDLDTRGYSPNLASVEDMANLMLASRGGKRVGHNWAQRFVQRRPELKMRFSRVYDFQRALCENPETIDAWFRLVENMRGKYGIQDCDFYNFDETGFMMGMIQPIMVVTGSERRGRAKSVQPGNREWSTAICCVNGEGWSLPPFLLVQGAYHLAHWYTETDLPRDWVLRTTINGWTNNEIALEWIKHFDKYTGSRTKGAYRMLVLDGHGSHLSAEFETYCKDHNIITLCLPAHSSHITQPLDVGCFGPLKRAYGREINAFIKAHINHITKVEFLIAFKAAYKASMTESNIKGGFRGAGLVPFDPQAVISKLDIKLRTPTPPNPPHPDHDSWTSQTPKNSTEALSQSKLVATRISKHQGSSPTRIFEAVNQMAKGMTMLAHSHTLMTAEVRSLRKANKALSKRRRAKKTRIRFRGSLTAGEAEDLLAEKEIDDQLEQEMRRNGYAAGKGAGGKKRCGKCGNTGHNARTCRIDEEMSNVYSSDSTE